MDAIPIPAGWYSDPAARHQQRYWDGALWTSHVVDSGIASEDSIAGVTDPVGVAVVGAGPGYRAAAVRRGQRVAVAVAFVALMSAFVFEVVATVQVINTRVVTFNEDFLWLASWLYKPADFASRTMYMGYPPLLLGIALVAALLFISPINVRADQALKRAGARSASFRSGPEDKNRWRTALSRLQSTRVRLFVRNYRLLLLLAGISSVIFMALSANAIFGRSAATTTGGAVTNLQVGLGPWVCLVAGAIAVACILLAWLWPRRPSVIVHADGSLESAP